MGNGRLPSSPALIALFRCAAGWAGAGQTSIDYLMSDIVNWAGPFFPEDDAPPAPGVFTPTNYVAVYDFLRDRLRAIASDINLQHIRDDLCVYVHERIARFFILAGYAPTRAPATPILPARP